MEMIQYLGQLLLQAVVVEIVVLGQVPQKAVALVLVEGTTKPYGGMSGKVYLVKAIKEAQ
jgi:hypothetical protein